MAVTTADGFLVAGVGETDVEWMGALGASSRRSVVQWEDQTLHVESVEINHVQMYVTSTGRPANAASVKAGMERILKS